ncbi:hypothetical protein RUM43_008124 [Polyplax serrata]|uniref:Uncharacterized protein n=1 Tax=Polyplax serrata TaxID=468196 RepID=A0AAN8P2S6_POLSC
MKLQISQGMQQKTICANDKRKSAKKTQPSWKRCRKFSQGACEKKPMRRGHVAPRTTIIETIIRKFDTHIKGVEGSREEERVAIQSVVRKARKHS